MKTLKLLSAFALVATFLSSCSADVFIHDETVVTDPVPSITLPELVSSYELWYVDINRSSGNGYIPFMQKAFTISFRNNGTVYANNNIVGIGNSGNGYGIDVGFYDTFHYELDISHDIDGFFTFEVTQLSNNEIELYYRPGNLRYILVGYQRSNFNYDMLFFDNIHYFLQEYVAWEKVYTSPYGDPNEFDYENFLQFLPGGGDGNFQSSEDPTGTNINNLYWDYTGIYNVDDVVNDPYLKYLTLDYDYLGNEYFELDVIDNGTIEVYQPSSGSVYRFKGRGYMQYKNAGEGKLRKSKADIEKSMIKISNVPKA